MSAVNIYCLIDPFTQEVRYVGKTVVSIHKRRAQHIYGAVKNNDKHHSARWIRSLVAKGAKPEVKLIEVVTTDNWEEREIYWIAEYGKTCRLTNHSSGGKGAEGKKGEASPKAVFTRQQVREAVTLYVLGCSTAQIKSLEPFKELSEKNIRSWAQKETRSCDTEGLPTRRQYQRGIE